MRVLLDPRTLARLERLVTLARRTPAARRRGARRPGRGIEPGSRRDYAPGDDVRLVDWPAYARLERLLVLVPEELPEPRLDLVLDGSGSMSAGAPSPGERAALAGAALAACAVAREVRVDVTWAGASLDRTTLRRPGELVRLLRFLAGQEAGGASRLAEAVGALVPGHGRGQAALLTDGLEPAAVADAARRLRARGFDPLVVAVDPAAEVEAADAEAAAEAGLAALVDAETGAARTIPFAPAALEVAREQRALRRRALAAALDAAGVPLEQLDPADPFEAVARALLRGPGRG